MMTLSAVYIASLMGAVWMALECLLFKHNRQMHLMQDLENKPGGAESGGRTGGVRRQETLWASIVTRQFLGIPPVRGTLHH